MSDPIIEAIERVLSEDDGFDEDTPSILEQYRNLAHLIRAAVTPLIRAAALEEAAKVADDDDGQFSYAGEHRNMAMLQQCCREIASAIRALKDQP